MMNYLGYLRKRTPARTPRRTLSHFLVCDSDKKKKCPCKHIFGLVFCASLPHFFSALRERKELCRLSEAFFFFSAVRFSPCSRMGFLGLCRASGARSRGARNAETSPSSRGNDTRESKIIRRERDVSSASPHRRSLGEAAQSPRGSEARGLLFAADPRFRYAPTHSRASVPAKKKERPAPACAAVGGNASFCAGFQCARAASRAAFFLSHLRTGSGIVPPSS